MEPLPSLDDNRSEALKNIYEGVSSGKEEDSTKNSDSNIKKDLKSELADL